MKRTHTSHRPERALLLRASAIRETLTLDIFINAKKLNSDGDTRPVLVVLTVHDCAIHSYCVRAILIVYVINNNHNKQKRHEGKKKQCSLHNSLWKYICILHAFHCQFVQ